VSYELDEHKKDSFPKRAPGSFRSTDTQVPARIRFSETNEFKGFPSSFTPNLYLGPQQAKHNMQQAKAQYAPSESTICSKQKHMLNIFLECTWSKLS